MSIVSVVLSGGVGTRLWPVSTRSLPKPFMKLQGQKSLLQLSIERGCSAGAEQTLVVTHEDYLQPSQEVALKIDPEQYTPRIDYLLEPVGRNTAPAIAQAALHVAETQGEDTIMLVLPADHLIPDVDAFKQSVMSAVSLAKNGQLVIFGITPTSPDTGFGYVEVQAIDKEPQQVVSFKEKPILPTAIEYLQSGRYYWNAGMFCFTAKTILDALSAAGPEFFQNAQGAFKMSAIMDLSQNTKQSGSARRFEAETFSMQKNVSLDYAVMETAATTGKVSIVPASFRWSDVGSWKAISESYLPDENGNTSPTQSLAVISHHHSYNMHVHCSNDFRKHIATVGINDVIIVDTPESLLLVHRNHAQEVGIIVNQIQNFQKSS